MPSAPRAAGGGPRRAARPAAGARPSRPRPSPASVVVGRAGRASEPTRRPRVTARRRSRSAGPARAAAADGRRRRRPRCDRGERRGGELRSRSPASGPAPAGAVRSPARVVERGAAAVPAAAASGAVAAVAVVRSVTSAWRVGSAAASAATVERGRVAGRARAVRARRRSRRSARRGRGAAPRRGPVRGGRRRPASAASTASSAAEVGRRRSALARRRRATGRERDCRPAGRGRRAARCRVALGARVRASSPRSGSSRSSALVSLGSVVVVPVRRARRAVRRSSGDRVARGRCGSGEQRCRTPSGGASRRRSSVLSARFAGRGAAPATDG